MRLRNIPGARDVIADTSFCIKEPDKFKGKWKTDVFHNDNPIHIEIGMGKGQFIMELAKRNPEINYVGIEKYSSVLLRGIQKMEELEEPLKNLVFIRFDAEYITNIFGEEEIDRIYLNFSDPWPKDRHAKRRLPSRQFLERYDHILKRDGVVEFKTDNRDLFEFALEEAPEAGWRIKVSTFDLHNDPKLNEGNIMTEYEERFSSMGNPICKYIVER
ncbi:MAG: tRNA (guanosine(46)-N7)-methyltransferase TrmB [Lachnospiraceae bacterium]|nr:tRNA (guanosine(46)-N7)-methyltransferase TrmB [Lachnospiraceae bacterium]